MAPPLVLMLLLGRRARAWPMFALTALLALLVFGDIVYYKFFGNVISVPALLAIHQTWRVWGTIRSLLSARNVCAAVLEGEASEETSKTRDQRTRSNGR